MRHRGFSLVEVIVVMGIVAVLAGLLFPVLAATKSKAGETVCMSNLKQLGTAMLMYKDDQGEFPWSNKQLDGYVGHTKLRCPQKSGERAYNLGTYANLGLFAVPAKDRFSRSYVQAIRDCFDSRGPQYPLLLDRNHLPKVLRSDDELYGVVLAFRLSGAVERVSKAKYVGVLDEIDGTKPVRSIPCKRNAQDANL